MREHSTGQIVCRTENVGACGLHLEQRVWFSFDTQHNFLVSLCADNHRKFRTLSYHGRRKRMGRGLLWTGSIRYGFSPKGEWLVTPPRSHGKRCAKQDDRGFRYGFSPKGEWLPPRPGEPEGGGDPGTRLGAGDTLFCDIMKLQHRSAMRF